MLTPKNKNGKYSALTDGVLMNHLQQKYAVAVYAGEHCSKFICFDVDDGKRETVHGVLETLVNMGFPRERIYVSFSGSKGYHIEMFFDQLVRTDQLKSIYDRVISATGYDPKKVEFRPTHGNAIKLPLSIHARTGNVCWFVDPVTLACIENYDYLVAIKQISADVLNNIAPATSWNSEAVDTQRQYMNDQERSNDDFSVCDDLTACGMRHDKMRRRAVFLRHNGFSEAEIRSDLLSWYERQDKAFIRSTQDEVMKDIDALVNWLFSEKFELRADRDVKRVRISATDMNMVLTAGKRSCKRILFLLLARSIVRQRAITLTEITRVTGISRPTAIKVIRELIEKQALRCDAGARIHMADHQFYCESNRYTVYHYCDDKSDKVLDFNIDDVMSNFDDCYHQAIKHLVPQSRIAAYLTADEINEHREYFVSASDHSHARIDEIGTKIAFSDERFGIVEAYEVKGRVLYPLVDVAQCMGLKNPDAMIKQCAAKEKWRVQTSRQVVSKNFIAKDDLRTLLKRSRAKNKQELID